MAARQRWLTFALAASVAVAAFALASPWLADGVSLLIAFAIGSALVYARRGMWTPAAAARSIERARPACRNVVVTAEELQRFPERSSAWMAERVRAAASQAVAGLAPGEVVPIGRPAGLVAVALIVAGVALTLTYVPAARETATGTLHSVAERAGVASPALVVTVHPPEYSRLPRQTLRNPERLDVLAGSRLVFALRGGADRFLRLGTRTIGHFRDEATLEVVVRESGYFAVESSADTSRTLIALAVRPDAAPVVRVEQPAKDLLLPNAQRTIPLSLSVEDDLEIASLELRYTKVAGAGETFTFEEGTLPLRVARTTSRQWQARGEFALAALQLAPGESIVYRAVARDRRSGDAAIGLSETFVVEIAGPGQVALEGIDMPPQEERYALSQQMIVLKIERLRARQPTLSKEALAEETALLAAEQRTVRANFIFLLGGHVEDEEVEAEQSHEIAEGRLENTARRDINRAIGDMTRAEQRLVAGDPGTALPPARAAVESLQRAFGRSRYLLRTLPVRSRIDPSRRLTGDLPAAGGRDRRATAVRGREGDAIRWLLSELVTLRQAVAADARVEPQAFDLMAEHALAVDPASPQWQAIARDLAAARQPAQLDAIIPRVAARAGDGLVSQTPLARSPSPLERAWERRR